MDTRDFTLLALLAIGGEIRGKTKLQKTIYFLGLMTDCLPDLGYRPHFYGPYSDDVADAVTWMKTIGILDQNVTSWGRNRCGFEVSRADYRLNEQGTAFAESRSRQYADLWNRLKAATSALQKAGDIDYMDLSIAAKTYFLLGQRRGPASKAELTKLASRFGWEVSAEQISRAGEYLAKLGLVEVS